ncbi:DUF5999 family protein [Streptomyces sp. CA-294286]|uniref:DUF5999 family protein n=1 Tax=Streptomyces sp. CA-294286 TaxID=3240070 RepID=UPI003D90D923
MCKHHPPCPSAESDDREATAITVTCREQGWARGCNGLYFFEDTGLLLPDGQIIAPHRPLPEHMEASA